MARTVTPDFGPEDTEKDSAEEKLKTLTYILKGGNWKQVPWMFD